MGQITNPIVKGITVLPIDRESGPGAGAGASGNRSIFLGQNAGLNSAVANLIVIGNSSGNGGMVDARLNGSTLLGVGTASALTTSTVGVPVFNAANTLLGSSNLAGIIDMDTTVVVGAGNFPLYAGANRNMSECIIIGNANAPVVAAAGNATTLIIIGNDNFHQTTDLSQSVSLVMLGNGNGSAGVVTNMANSQIIGSGIAFTGSASAGCTLIGDTIVQGANLSFNIIIGQSAQNSSSVRGRNVIIGVAAVAAQELNTVIGFQAASSGASSGCVVIGANATTAKSNALLISSSTAVGGGSGNAASPLIFGDFTVGNILLGTSAIANQEFGGVGATNVLKLLNGTKGGSNPVGGGYFYVTAGALHYVGTAGTDTTIAPA